MEFIYTFTFKKGDIKERVVIPYKEKSYFSLFMFKTFSEGLKRGIPELAMREFVIRAMLFDSCYEYFAGWDITIRMKIRD